MKRSITIALALLIATTAQALPRHVLFAIPVATWQDASPVKRDKIRTFFRRFADPSATATVGAARYIHTASGTPVFVCAFWTEHLERYREKINAEKIAAIKTQLADNNIRMVFVDDLQAQLSAWGLAVYVDPDGEVLQ